MNPPDNEPTNRPPSLYQLTADKERKGGGGMIVLVLIVLLLAGGGGYYFYKNNQPKPVVAAALPAAATPAPAQPTAAPRPTPYNSVTEQKYIDEADATFMAIQQPKLQAFKDAFAEFKAAGYVNPQGLTTKELVSARRAVVAKCIAANDDFAAFVATQESVYKDALAKTPLTPVDAQKTWSQYVEKVKTPEVIKLRGAQHDYLKSCDDMLAALEKWYGNWSVTPAGKLSFKRKENIGTFNEIAQKTNVQAALVAKLQNDYEGVLTPGGSATGGQPDAVVPATVPAASATPAAAQP